MRQQQPGTRKWINDWVVAHPVAPQNRSKRFESALAATSLDRGFDKSLDFHFLQSNFDGAIPQFGGFDADTPLVDAKGGIENRFGDGIEGRKEIGKES